MAQTQFTNYRSAVESFPLGQQKIGLLKPGRYNGFDTLTNLGSNQYRLSHSGSHVRKTNIDNEAENTFGAIIMPNGIIIHEDEHVDLTILGGGSNTTVRSLIICQLDYAQVVGGVPAQYSVIQGTDASIPTLTNPAKQVAIGVVTIRNTVSITNVIYEPIPAPLPGDLTVAGLYESMRSLVLDDISQYPITKEVITNSDIADYSLNMTHNNKIIRFLPVSIGVTNMYVNIPAGLPLNFECEIITDTTTTGTGGGVNGYSAMPGYITVRPLTGVDIRTKSNLLQDYGGKLIIKNIGIIDQYVVHRVVHGTY